MIKLNFINYILKICIDRYRYENLYLREASFKHSIYYNCRIEIGELLHKFKCKSNLST